METTTLLVDFLFLFLMGENGGSRGGLGFIWGMDANTTAFASIHHFRKICWEFFFHSVDIMSVTAEAIRNCHYQRLPPTSFSFQSSSLVFSSLPCFSLWSIAASFVIYIDQLWKCLYFVLDIPCHVHLTSPNLKIINISTCLYVFFAIFLSFCEFITNQKWIWNKIILIFA